MTQHYFFLIWTEPNITDCWWIIREEPLCFCKFKKKNRQRKQFTLQSKFTAKNIRSESSFLKCTSIYDSYYISMTTKSEKFGTESIYRHSSKINRIYTDICVDGSSYRKVLGVHVKPLLHHFDLFSFPSLPNTYINKH